MKTTLSERELQVYKAIAEGMTVSEIGRSIYLSVKTISTYRARILAKLGLKNNAQIVKHAIRAGVVTVEPLPAEAQP